MGTGTRNRDVPAPAGPPASRRPQAEDAPRVRFRRFLATRMGGVEEGAWYLETVRPRLADEQALLAAEEVVNHLGRLMGFEAARQGESAVSTWSSSSGAQMRVAIVDAGDAIAAFSRAARACEALDVASAREGRPDGLLCVVCGDDRRHALEQALEVRRMSRSVRLVSIDALLALARSVEAATIPHDLAAAAVAPGVSADRLVTLLAR